MFKRHLTGVIMKPKDLFQTISIFFILIFGLIITVSAQSELGRIAGTITDVNGGAVAGATVTITKESTGEVRTVNGTSEGTFQIASLQLTLYTVAVTAANFETMTRKNVAVLA